jgi:predicted enzyme related to lactoylglutathione lyase
MRIDEYELFRWQGSINHFSITVSDLDRAMEFLEPVLDFLGYTEHERGSNSGTRLTINLNTGANIAFNV